MLKPINVHVVVTKESQPYFEYLIQNFRHTASQPERLFFFCYALDRETYQSYANHPDVSACYAVYEDLRAYRRVTWQEWKMFIKAQLTRRPMLGGSNGHSAGLNKIMEIMPLLAGHHVIADSDVALLLHGWDEKTDQYFEDFHLIGITYEDMGGVSSGLGRVQTYKKFPIPIWLAIREDCDLMGMDWFSRKEKNVEINTIEKSKLYSLPIGYEMICDVGWAFPKYCYEKEYKAKAMQWINPTSHLSQVIKTENDYNEEHQLDGMAFVGHQRGGSRNPFRKTKVSSLFYNCVERAVGKPK